MSLMFEQQTGSIFIRVRPRFEKDQSQPERELYLFSYEVLIENRGQAPVQLLRRHWLIKDGMGRVEEVEGDGVVGLQPRIEPGQVFQYSSFCPLPTPTGSMSGFYYLVDSGGKELKVTIPTFSLSEPTHLH